MRDHGYAEFRMDFAKVLVAGDTSIPGKGPAQSALPRVRCDQTPHTRGDDEGFQCNSTGVIPDCLVEEFQDRHGRRATRDTFQIAQTEHHADAEKPGCHESDAHGAHDGDRDHLLRSANLFGQVRGAVQTGKGPITVD